MNIRSFLNFAVISVVIGITPAMAKGNQPDRQTRQLFAMTPSDFQRVVDLKDDSLEPIAVLTTMQGFQKKAGLLGVVYSDSFLRAFVNKDTGATTFQVFVYMSYDAEWQFFQSVNFRTQSGLHSAVLTVIGRDVLSCNSIGCLHVEKVGFGLTENDVRWIANQYDPQTPNPWQFRLKAKSGNDPTGNLMPAEFAGILAAVESYRQKHGIVPKTTPTP